LPSIDGDDGMIEKKEEEIGIIGIGSVGDPLKRICEVYSKEVRGYDKKGSYDWKPILGCGIVFVCVPTPEGKDGRLDCGCVEEVLTRLDKDCYQGIVAIKSTLRVGFMDEACALHPNLRLVYCPEFLREKSALQWTVNPDRLVVSGNPEDARKVLSVFVWAENAKTIVTDYRSAEIGKLAHNAFIATKVSFTNEIERISEEQGANPEDVMEIVTSDRRVISKEHLRPNLGPYGGKCVPKDTKELKNASKSEFLQAVERVNEETNRRYSKNPSVKEDKQTLQKKFKIVAVIPTKSRLPQLGKALASVANQTRPPDELVIVGEEENDFPNDKKTITGKLATTRVHWLLNERTRNLSGAANTAVQFLIGEETDPAKTHLAFLDDDDTWEPQYLQFIHEKAIEEGKDLIISGLIRHDTEDDKGVKLTIPERIHQKMFLVGNPHIQGSNLFVRMSAFLRAGGFDENLPSTTDRDFMIRILDLGDTTYSCIPRHLVHHHAHSSERLSAHGSSVKITGLTRFLQKCRLRMTDEEILEFKQRATSVFGWTEDAKDLLEPSSTSVPVPPLGKTKQDFHLVVGFTASHLTCASNLLHDLKGFQKSFALPISLVVLDNTGAPQQLEQLIHANESGFSMVKIISRDEVEKDAESGKLGTFYMKKERRKGPSYGRTGLHRYLYLTGIELDKPIFWILDDDVRLDKILYASNNQTVTPAQFRKIIDYLLEKRIAICVGGIVGDPPLPIASSIRGQLLELDSSLRNLQTNQETPEKRANADGTAQRFPDQYYDLSISHYDHLETPLRLSANFGENTTAALLRYAAAIFEGRNLLRPALPVIGEIKMRGGNTIVTDIECLRTHTNTSPRINGVELRRGDTIWVELNRYVGGELVGRETKRVISLPLFVRQERAPTVKPKLLSDTFAADIQGGAFVRAFTNLIERKSEITGKMADIGTVLSFSEEECRCVVAETNQNLETRLNILRMNAWRIDGLISAIRHQIDSDQTGSTKLLDPQEANDLENVLDWIEREMSIPNVYEFCHRLKKDFAEGITEFLAEFEKDRLHYASNLGLEATDEQKTRARKLIKRHFGVTSIELIGQGQEGLVYSDGTKAYKYFITNGVQRKTGLLKLIKEKLKPSAGLKRIVTVEKLVVEGNQVLLAMPFIEGQPYDGGRLLELLELLRECRRAGLVTTNLWPKNLIVGKNGLVYVDVGRSIVPYQESLFSEMCKRAFLTYRWHFRTDLRELLTRSIHDSNMPELFGFEEFKKAVEQVDVHSQMDTYLISECLKTKAKKVLDYGCGKGSIADKLAEKGCDVDCYDPDSSAFNLRPHRQKVKLLSARDLSRRIKQHHDYDLVLCNLVLCTIKSQREVGRVSRKLRSLVSQNGHVIVGLCNPLSDGVLTSPSQTRRNASGNEYHAHFEIREITPKGNQRTDWHRPLSWYEQVFRKSGLEIEGTTEVPSVDIERLSPSSDQILLTLHPLQKPTYNKTVSLMIKASAMEWQTIEKQVRHIVSQLEGPQEFLEKILATDNAAEGFARQYATADLPKFCQAVQKLLEDHVIDRVVSAPSREKEIKRIYRKWFGIECSKPRAANGQPIYMTLYGLEQCKGNYVLQTDSDCIFLRKSRDHDYLGEMIKVLEDDQSAVTVSLPIPYGKTQPYKKEGENKPFRVEVRCCLLKTAKLRSILPLENEIENNALKLPWHRSLDQAIQEGKATSYRGGNPQTCFLHIQNFRKTDINDWMNVIDAAENEAMLAEQTNKIQLVGEAADWVGKRNEEMIILMRGKDVPLSKIRRCVASLRTQSFKEWSVVIIDAGSSNGTEDLYKFVLKKQLGDKLTFVRNHIPMSPMENIDFVTSSICRNTQSIIVHLDLDDALIEKDALSKVKEAYRNRADTTVGSMLRTDKQTEYTVTLKNPRANRGGNVWLHLRTYRKYLYDKIPKDYFQIDAEWIKHSEDWAFMIPIVELAKNPVHLKDKIYFYEPSDDKSNRDAKEREAIISKIIAKPSLEGNN
jgi:glycosyltransferase involved in cell wall biosynthesis/2-polyprenyl-3-methyl-5-hydroxy-6-metoxy-1,4-benzoquinol methylase